MTVGVYRDQRTLVPGTNPVPLQCLQSEYHALIILLVHKCEYLNIETFLREIDDYRYMYV